MKKICEPASRTIKQFVKINSGFLARLKPEIVFFLKGVEFFNKLQSCGMPICRPVIAPKEERTFMVDGGYNVHLAVTMLRAGQEEISRLIVKNDMAMSEKGRILIITGPNRGGKTVFIQAVGLIQIMAQVGLFVPGISARISPVDGIYTHYQIEESPDSQTGRFGDEAKRLYELFEQVTPYSLVLMNESLSSTSYGESLYLAEDLMKILRQLGARAVFSTHIHDLAANAEAINREVSGSSRLLSMVSEVMEEPQNTQSGIRRTYRIVEGPPKGHSYANEIAEKYGISYAQLRERLNSRGYPIA
jgi:DNA mismatch repair ATPase MutS